MGLKDLTRPAVASAIAEFDRRGRDAFLREHGFGRSRGYFLVQDGREYDSKAIAGAAHGHLGPGWQPLRPTEFAGGERTVARVLGGLGYEVVGPAERRDEALPFETGQLYNRQRDIHQRYAGQQQGGISTPAGAPYVFLFTGETGAQYGYSDGWRDDGLFAYTGEGQRGDMQFVRGNKSIRDHWRRDETFSSFRPIASAAGVVFWAVSHALVWRPGEHLMSMAMTATCWSSSSLLCRK